MSKYRVVVIWQLNKDGGIVIRCSHLKFGSFPKDWDSWGDHPVYSEIHNIYDKVPTKLYEECACDVQPGPVYASVKEGEGTFFAELIYELISNHILEKTPIYVHLSRTGQIVSLNYRKSGRMLCEECHVVVGLLVAGQPESIPVKWSIGLEPMRTVEDTKIYQYTPIKKPKNTSHRTHTPSLVDYSGRWNREII